MENDGNCASGLARHENWTQYNKSQKKKNQVGQNKP